MIRQSWTLIARCYTIKRKDLWNTLILAAQAPVVALLVVLVFGDQTSKPLDGKHVVDWPNTAESIGMTVFLITLSALWFGCSNAAREIVGEWPVYHRERMINLLVPSYIASKLTVLGGLSVLQCAVLLGITHWGCSLKGPWVSMFFVLVLVSFVGVAIGLTLSALARTSEVAIALLPIILLPMIILGGALKPVHELWTPIRALCYVIPSRWAFEAALLQEARNQPQLVLLNPLAAPSQAAAKGAESKSADPANDENEKDMAEHYFPKQDHRVGVATATLVLLLLLSTTVAAVHQILLSRDVHRVGIAKRLLASARQ